MIYWDYYPYIIRIRFTDRTEFCNLEGEKIGWCIINSE